jgi:hypothetical protein
MCVHHIFLGCVANTNLEESVFFSKMYCTFVILRKNRELLHKTWKVFLGVLWKDVKIRKKHVDLFFKSANKNKKFNIKKSVFHKTAKSLILVDFLS